MTRYALVSMVLLLAAPAAAQDGSKSFDLAREKVAECQGEKFVFAWGVGARPTKVTLCSDKNASTSDIVRMLNDAASKIEANKAIAEDRRIAIVDQIRAKVAQYQAAEPAAPVAAIASPPPPMTEHPVQQHVAPVTALEPVVPPPAPAPAPVALAAPVASPRLTFGCISPDFPGGGSCVTLTRDTIITVRSAAALPAGVSLRFVRNREPRAEVALGAIGKGRTVRLALPGPLCSGVSSAEVEIAVVRGGRQIDQLGPLLLRC